jgi:putative endonuclease
VRPLDGFAEAGHTRGRGRVGEEAAVRWLEARGFRIVARNVVTKAGEIDLVVQEGDTLCFLEVKARGTADYGPAIAAVGPAKQRRLSRAAALYLVRHRWAGPCRFDVLGLDREDEGSLPAGARGAESQGGWRFTLVRDAFPYCG